MRTKTCKTCGVRFVPTRPMQPTCQQFDCMLAYGLKAADRASKAREKADRAETKAKLEKLKTLTEYANEAQQAFNAWIRARDLSKGYGCISCGTHKAVQWHAGHYRTVKAAKQLRYHPDNVNLQCSQCNSHDGGNVVEYRINLVKRIGLERVEALECNNEIRRYTKEELIQIKNEYRKKLKEGQF